MEEMTNFDMKLGSELFLALAKAQEEYPPIPQTEYNPFFKSTYAPLKEINKAVDPVLLKHGLIMIQRPIIIRDIQALESILLHKSGQYIRGVQLLQPVKADPQGMGSAMSYARRYSKSAMLGLTTEPDDDATVASKRSAPKQEATKKPPVPPKTQGGVEETHADIAADLNKEIHKLGSLLKMKHEAISQMAHNKFDCESMSDLTVKQQMILLIHLYGDHLDMAETILTWCKKAAPKKENPGPEDMTDNQVIATLKKLRRISVEGKQEAA